MEILLWFLIPSLLTVVGCKLYYRETICPKEMALQCGVAVIFSGFATGLAYISLMSTSYETNLVHGEVIDKWQSRVSCSHSYSCPPCRQVCTTSTTGTGKSAKTTVSCRKVCSTCYDHDYDYDWRVDTSFGVYEIDRINRQGTKEPPRWTSIEKGDPVTSTYRTENWLKATDNLLLPKKVELTEAQIAELPTAPYVFDYYNVNLVRDLLPPSIPVDTKDWNRKIRLWERKAGPERHVSVWLVLTDKDPTFADRLLWHYRGGQKNEVIMIYGVATDGSVAWFRAHSFANGMNNNTMLQKLRQAALGNKLDYSVVETQLGTILSDFRRQPGKEFKDLIFETLSVSWWLIGILLVIQLVLQIFIARFFHQEDMFSTSRQYRLSKTKKES